MTDIITDERLAEIRAGLEATTSKTCILHTHTVRSLLARLDKAEATVGHYMRRLSDMGFSMNALATADDVDLMLDPQWSKRIARLAIATDAKAYVPDETLEGSRGQLADANSKNPHVP